MSQGDWQTRLARVIAGEVRRYRSKRKMSAQQLADRCAQLGMEIPRAVLANLENGRRPLVSVAELLVLAAALDVPPIVLAIPVGHQETVEILPDIQIPTLDAARWWQGETGLADLRSENGQVLISDALAEETALDLIRAHQEAVARWMSTYGTAQQVARAARFADDPAEADRFRSMVENQQRNLDHFAKEISEWRRDMRARKLILPSLPTELAPLDDEDTVR